MSNIYALEPHTNAKVILHTTAGDIEIELWGKETPKAARNFIQLCMEGYYDNTIFHRIVPGFIIQGGDPTGTGFGGESIYEQEGEFPNEYHSRLRFNRRGLVGMANTGEDNGSQFFITLDRADELDKTHTLFGRVAGDTVFNVLKMAEMEIDDNERPLYPPKIKTTEIALNPFDDIVPRISRREKEYARKLEMQKAKQQEEEAQKKKKGRKQLNLLSFGEEAAAEEVPEGPETKKRKKTKSTPPPPPPPPSSSIKSTTEESIRSQAPPVADEEKHKEEKKEKPKESVIPAQPSVPEQPKSHKTEIERLKAEIKNIGQEEPEQPQPVKKKVSVVREEREKYMKSGKAMIGGVKARKRQGRKADDETMSRFFAFQQKLSSTQAVEPAPKKEQAPCALHHVPGCESCHAAQEEHEEEEILDNAWMGHSFVAEKDHKGKDLMQRNESVDDYLVIDPRHHAQEKEKKKGERSGESRRRDEDDRGRRDDRRRRDDRDRGSRGDRDRYASSSSSSRRHRDDDDYERRRRRDSRERRR